METLESTGIQPDIRQAEVASALAGSLAVKERTEKVPRVQDSRPGLMVITGTDAPNSIVSKRDNLSLGLTIRPYALDNPDNLGDPKVSLQDGSQIYHYDFFTDKTDEWTVAEELDPEGSPVIDPTPEGRLIIVSTPDGSTRYAMTQDYYGTTQSLELGILEEPGGQKFLERLGYIFVNGQVYAPSPATFKAFCGQQGVDVEIFPDKSELKAEEYLKAYSEGKYPIGALDSYYSHDIQDDHITALLVGGPELQRSIQDAVIFKLKHPGTVKEDLTQYMDEFTNTFRSVILPHGSLGAAYGKESGRRTIKDYGEKIGISPEEIDKLIAIAQQRARDFGLEPKELD